MRFITVIAMLLLAATQADAKLLEIVQRGEAKATLVVAKKDSDAGMAAFEIRKFIQKMSGVRLPLVKEGNPIENKNGVLIYVGHTRAAKKAGVEIPAGFNPAIRPEIFTEEGYVLKTVENQIFIGGNGDGPYHGTRYAAYAFLEKLGCRWYFPGEWGEVIPEKKSLIIPDLDIQSKPDFAMRVIWLNGRWGVTPAARAAYKKWCMRVGFSSDQMHMYPLPLDGSLAMLMTPKEYAESHPEFFAMNKQGIRDATPKSNLHQTMLCLTNKDMVREYIKNVKEAFAGKRHARNVNEMGVGISPPDGVPACYDEKCKAASQNFNFPRYTHRTMQSEEAFGFANKLATAFPDKFISVAAYALREIPPQGVKLLPNIAVMAAPISCCVIHPNNDPTCWRRQEFMKILKHWTRLSSHVWLYDYTPGMLVSQFEPERDVANFAINAKIYKKAGIKGFSREGSNSMMASWISYYVSAKLMWDVNADVDAIKKDFYTHFFGPKAGPLVQAWWDACEAKLLESKVHVHESWLVSHLYTSEFVRSIHPYVQEARKADMTPKQKDRFKIFLLIVENFEASTQMNDAAMAIDYKKAAACAERMLVARTKLNQVSDLLIGKRAQTGKWNMFTFGRKLKYQELDAKTNGEKGKLVVPLPLEMKFKRDPYNVGITSEWYLPEFNDKNWKMENTFYTWDAQDEPLDAVGHDYDGHGWYRATIAVPPQFKDKPIRFSSEAINEAWVWVNGEYVGHKSHVIWWMGQSAFEFDVTRFMHPGKNTIAIRVWNDAEIGGLLNRGIFWSPKEP